MPWLQPAVLALQLTLGMLTPRRLLPTLLLALLMSGCSSYKRELARGVKLEQQGRYAEALAIFDRNIAKIPQENTSDRDRAEAYVHLGNCLLQTDRMNDAFASYQKALEFDPKNVDANLDISELLVAAGMAQSAQPYIAVAVQIQPNNATALATMGAVQASMGKLDQAMMFYRRALAVDPTRVNVSVSIAEIYNRNNKVQDAREVLTEAGNRNPTSPVPWLALGRIEEQEGDATAAERDYRRATSVDDSPQTNLRLAQFLQRTAQVQEAETVLAKVDKMTPGDATSLGDFELASGRSQNALREYLTALTAQVPLAGVGKQKAGTATNADDGGTLAARAVEAALSRGGDPQNVIEARRVLNVYRPTLDAATLASLEAEIALVQEDLPLAGAQAKLAVEKAPDSAAAHFLLAEVRQRESKIAEAKAEFTAAFTADPSHVPSRLALADLELKEGSNVAAEEHASAVVREEPANLRALEVYARVLTQQGRYDSARSIAERAMAVDKQAVGPRITLGEIAFKQDRLPTALLEYEQAVLLDPHSQEALQGLVRVYRRGKFNRPMIQRMEKVAEAPPASSTLMEIAGRLYADHGWNADAAHALRRAAQLDSLRSPNSLGSLALEERNGGDKQHPQSGSTNQRPASLALISALQAEQAHDLDAAIHHYEAAVKAGDPKGVAANNLAWLYAENGKKLDRALQLAEMAHERDPRNPAIADTLGVVHLKRRSFTDAVSVLQEGIRIAEQQRKLSDARSAKTTEHELYLHLAEAFTGIGDDRAASSARAKAAAL